MRILKASVRARNDDKYLAALYYEAFLGISTFREFADSPDAPALESITRLRRRIQRRGLYPATPKVAAARKVCASEYKKFTTRGGSL